jgi:hypothetical protein
MFLITYYEFMMHQMWSHTLQIPHIAYKVNITPSIGVYLAPDFFIAVVCFKPCINGIYV